MTNKVECLKGTISAITSESIKDIPGNTVCEVLHELNETIEGMEFWKMVKGLKVNFARKVIDGNTVLLGNQGNISIFLVLSDGQEIPVTVEFTDVA